MHLEDASNSGSSHSSPDLPRKRTHSADNDIDVTQELRLTELMGQERTQEKSDNARITKRLAPKIDTLAAKRRIRELVKGVGLQAEIEVL